MKDDTNSATWHAVLCIEFKHQAASFTFQIGSVQFLLQLEASGEFLSAIHESTRATQTATVTIGRTNPAMFLT